MSGWCLLGGRLLRDGVLLQSALSANDSFCSAAKASALLEMVLDVVDACQRLVARGVAATTVEDLDFGPALRARDELGPSDAEGVHSRHVEFLQELERLS